MVQILFFILGYAGHIFRDYDRYSQEITLKEYITANLYDLSNTGFMAIALFLVYIITNADASAVNCFFAGYTLESGLRFILKKWER